VLKTWINCELNEVGARYISLQICWQQMGIYSLYEIESQFTNNMQLFYYQ